MVRCILTVMVALIISGSALSERLRVDMNERVYRGGSIDLWDELVFEDSSLDFRRIHLREIILVAKSANGSARASLQIESTQSPLARVPKGEGEFAEEGSYSRISFRLVEGSTPRLPRRGRLFPRWRLNLIGTIKVDSIVFDFDRYRGRPSLGLAEAELAATAEARELRFHRARCTYVLDGRRGRAKFFTSEAVSRSRRVAKFQACLIAKRRCEVFERRGRRGANCRFFR